MRDAPFWLARNASDLLWMEDDCTRRQEGHESGVAAWERIFGDARPIEAQEHYDGGDCDFYLFADGRIYLHACDADEIRFLRVEADDPALRGYECAGNSASLRCHWVGEVPRRTKHYDAPMCPQCASASAYPRRMIYGGKFPAFANWAPSLPASPAEPPARVVLIDLAHSSDMQIKARLHAKAQAAAQLTEGLDQVLRTFAAPPAEAERKLTFGELTAGEHFIGWPLPGDNAGHGGYRGSQRLFTKLDTTTAINQQGSTSSMPDQMPVIRVSC